MDIRVKQRFGALYAVTNSITGATETSRDYKKAAIDALIIAAIAAVSVLVGFGYPPQPEVLYSTVLAFIFAFLTSLARKLEIEDTG
jgi:hypothetical protein